MDAPTIPVSAEENLRDPIEIRVDVVHPAPVATVAFPVATVVRTLARHGEVIRGLQDRLLEMPIQRVRSLEVVETWLHGIVKDEKEALERIKRQLGYHTPKRGLDGIRVRRRDVIAYIAQDQENDHYMDV
ncbi:hypothetical protein Tco_1351159 [Tanacetum coccineum]